MSLESWEHVTEEARHVCFAEHYLREHLPKVPNLQRAAIRSPAELALARARLDAHR